MSTDHCGFCSQSERTLLTLRRSVRLGCSATGEHDIPGDTLESQEALRYVPLARKNFGGVKTNLRCQVLDKHYEPIPGLYAAGELTGMAGGHMNGKAGLARCWARRCSAAGSLEPGPHMKQATARDSPARQTAGR